MNKNFVLDTNVLLHDAGSLFAFGDNTVCIPIYVIEEIDSFKRDMTERGRAAREVVRQLDRLRQGGKLTAGVPLETGGSVRVVFARDGQMPGRSIAKTVDDRILDAALTLRGEEKDSKTVLITKDINLRIRADALGLAAEDYDREGIDVTEIYAGWREAEVSDEAMAGFFSDGEVALEDLELSANEYVSMTCPGGGDPALGRYSKTSGRVGPLAKKRRVSGIRARNREQQFAFDLLLDDEVQLVTLLGKAGTGKTLLALAAGLYKVGERGGYQKLLVSRPVIPMGRDIGFLPGDIEAKMDPWMKPVHDNLEYLMNLSPGGMDDRRPDDFTLDGMVVVEPLTFLRGRSIPNQFIIIDEAQNLTPHEVKTIITRAGDGTKIVMTGDPDQIDNPYLDAVNNGLTFLIQNFRDQPIAGTITLAKGERSPLAELASNIL